MAHFQGQRVVSGEGESCTYIYIQSFDGVTVLDADVHLHQSSHSATAGMQSIGLRTSVTLVVLTFQKFSSLR